MRILLSHDSCEGFGGTETYMLTVAEQLQRTGHDVSIFAVKLGPAAEEARQRGLRVFSYQGLPESCDVVLAQDAGTCLEMSQRYPSAARIMTAHSSDYPLQCPPQLPGVCQAIVALNDRMLLWAQGLEWAPRIVRLRQPVDMDRFRLPRARRSGRRRILVLSNYPFGTRAEQIAAACEEAGWELKWLAGGTITPEEQIANSDAVLGLGRSALESMAAARAALVLGPLGGDGWVTPINYSQIEGDGFVGQATARVLDRSALVSELSSWEPTMGNYNRDMVARHHDVRQHASELVALAREIGAPNTTPYGCEAELARLVRLEHQRTNAVYAARRESDRLVGELDQAHEREHQLREELDRERVRFQALLATRKWRAAAALARPLDAVRERRRRPVPSARAVEEQLVQASLARQLGMEGDGQDIALPNGHRVAINAGQNLDIGAVISHPGGPDEDGVNGPPGDALEVKVGLERTELTAERVALGPYVEHPEVVTVEHDHPGTRSEDRIARTDELAQRIAESLALDPQAHHRRFAPGDDKRVESV
jgi:hypothetical protein